jgi:hypothetical protein
LLIKIGLLAFACGFITIFLFPQSRVLIYGITSEEQIFEIMKRHLLNPQDNTLKANHLDASIFDNILHGEFHTVCRLPKSHWFVRQDMKNFSPERDYWPVDIAIVIIAKGNCEECWDRAVISATVSSRGSYHQFPVSRLPNRDGEVREGKLYYTGYCGPVPNDQADLH